MRQFQEILLAVAPGPVERTRSQQRNQMQYFKVLQPVTSLQNCGRPLRWTVEFRTEKILVGGGASAPKTDPFHKPIRSGHLVPGGCESSGSYCV
jgi:hypothetical protein